MAGLIWILLIGFVAGTVARLLMPGPDTPKGFLLTTVLGVAGALLATYIGDAAGLYRPHQFAADTGTTAMAEATMVETAYFENLFIGNFPP